MFEGLKKAFQGLVRAIAEKELSEEEAEEAANELAMRLVESDVAVDVAYEIAEAVKSAIRGVKGPRIGDREAAVRQAIIDALLRLYSDIPDVDLLAEAAERAKREKPVVMLFMGPNGFGKTTTIAKLTYAAMRMGMTAVWAAADTYRAGAVEQLEEHARRLKVRVVAHGYGADPAAVAYDAIQHARARGIHLVMIDSAGRLHTDRNLMDELAKIQRVAEPHYSILVFDTLLGNDAVEIARTYARFVRVDGLIGTKADANPRGGSILTMIHILRKPIYYLGTGQRYEDLTRFDKKTFIESLI